MQMDRVTANEKRAQIKKIWFTGIIFFVEHFCFSFVSIYIVMHARDKHEKKILLK